MNNVNMKSNNKVNFNETNNNKEPYIIMTSVIEVYNDIVYDLLSDESIDDKSY